MDVSHILWMSIINKCDGCLINMNMMDSHHLWIWWMSIIYEWDECPSCMTYARIEFWMPVIYDGCPSYLMYYSHKCPSFTWTSSVMEPMESFSRRNKMVNFEVHMELMESEVRECREYGDDWIKGTVDREKIDLGLDGIEGKNWNEGIRTMALMEFMKLMEPTQLMLGLIFMKLTYLMKLMVHMKIIG